MNCLVDTHYLIWSLCEPSRLGTPARRILDNPDILKLVSKVTFWEIALKYSIGKLKLTQTDPEGLLRAALSAGFTILDIDVMDLASFHRLPPVEGHKDPFDRLLVWQCIRHDLQFLSADSAVRAYVPLGLVPAVTPP